MELKKINAILAEEGVLLCYRGFISQQITETVGDALRTQLELSRTSPSIGMRVFAAFVEMAQNIEHYSVETQPDGNGRGSGVVIIGHEADVYYVHCGNVIDRAESDNIRDRLERIKQMGRDELKAYYREMRRGNPHSESKGAGLGFIELARNTKEIKYDISEIDDARCYFSLRVYI